MKYIRTKDGIYELMPNIEQDYKVSFDGETLEPAYYSINHEWVAKRDVIKQADIIEELCDVFVVIANGFPFQFVNEPCQDLYNEFDKKNMQIEKIYGAIWTDKGLIYVAKMNEKGELELL